jgi:hypothetical protein
MPEASILDDFVTFEALAAEANVSVRTVRRWSTSTTPGLPVTKLGRQPLVHRDDLRAWLAARRVARNVPRGAARARR